MSDPNEIHGWTAVPLDHAALLDSVKRSESKSIVVDDIPLPDSPLAKEVLAYAKKELSEQTFNHSMRVYYYGRAIQLQHFPAWSLSPETLLLTSLLHDIGTTPHAQKASNLSFEYHGGLIAHALLLKHSPSFPSPSPLSAASSKEQADAVTEAIIRHQDIGSKGNITALGALIQLATIFDNTGGHAELLHERTIEDVIAKFNRRGWSRCFVDVIEAEVRGKPWAHTTALGPGEEGGFVDMVRGNKVGGRWD